MEDLITRSEKIQKLKEWFDKTRLDEAVMEATLQMKTDRVTPKVLTEAASKLVKVNRGEVPEDNRDGLQYAHFLGLEDFVHEHIMKDAGHLQKGAVKKMTQKKDLSWLHAGYFTPQVRSTIIGNPLSLNTDGNNPIEVLDLSHRVTKMGPGGISDTSAIPAESRQVNPTQFGFLDVLHMPEDQTIGVTSYFTRNVRKGRDGKLYRLMLDNNGKECWVNHEKLISSTVAVPMH